MLLERVLEGKLPKTEEWREIRREYQTRFKLWSERTENWRRRVLGADEE